MLTTTVIAKIVTSSPTCETETFSSPAMSGSSPVGRNSLETEAKIAPEMTSSAEQRETLLLLPRLS